MRRSLLSLAVVACLLSAGASDVFGCGDKFVLLGRGARFGRVHAAARPASILIFSAPESHMAAASKEFRLESTLKQAGHSPSTVESAGAFQKAVSSGRYDLVLADISESDSLERTLRSASSTATVIPVVYNPTPSELADAEKQHGCLVKVSRKNTDLLSVIDDAMVSRAKGAGANCQKAR